MRYQFGKVGHLDFFQGFVDILKGNSTKSSQRLKNCVAETKRQQMTPGAE